MWVWAAPTTCSDIALSLCHALIAARRGDNLLQLCPEPGRVPQVEQGLGLGSGFPFFNRCTGSATRFLKLRDVPETSRSPPPVLVLHARAGTAVGDIGLLRLLHPGRPFLGAHGSDSCCSCVRACQFVCEILMSGQE